MQTRLLLIVVAPDPAAEIVPLIADVRANWKRGLPIMAQTGPFYFRPARAFAGGKR
jgi:hypothetical protein